MAVTKIAIVFGLLAYFSHAIPVQDKNLSERIVGGTDAGKGDVPHMVALVFGTHVISLNCGGSIISRRHILTAAHCITSFVSWDGSLLSTLRGVVGSNRWESHDHLVEFEHFHNHPEYDSTWIKNDVGILVLAKELELNEKVGIVQLDFNYVGSGVKSIASGWGRIDTGGGIPDFLQVLNLTTVSGKECHHILQEHSIWAPPVDSYLEICAFHSHGHGMCNGDSGSALVDLETGLQIGIVSWGFPCANGVPDVFASPAGSEDFITSIVEEYN